MKAHVSKVWRVLWILALGALALGVLTALASPLPAPVVRLAEVFPALRSEAYGGQLGPSAKATYAVQWLVIPLYALLFFVALLRSKTYPRPTEPPRLTSKEKVAMVGVTVIGVVYVTGSLGLTAFPTCMNGELLFSQSAKTLPVASFPGYVVVAWVSAFCEALMLILSLAWAVLAVAFFFERRHKAQPGIQPDEPASGGSAG